MADEVPSQPTTINSIACISHNDDAFEKLAYKLLDSRNRWLAIKKCIEYVAPGIAVLGAIQTLGTIALFYLARQKGTFAPTIWCVATLVLAGVVYYIAHENARTKQFGYEIPREHDNAKAEEVAWARTYEALMARFDRFNKRLEALQKCNAVAGPGQLVDENVVRKYEEERAALLDEQARIIREHALIGLMAALNADVGTKYRDTRDLSDVIYAAKVRVEDASAATMTAGTSEPDSNDEPLSETATVRKS